MPRRQASNDSSVDGIETLRELSLYLAELHGPEAIAEGSTRIIAAHSPGAAVRLWLGRSNASCPACPDPEHCRRQLACLVLAAAAGLTEGLSEEPENLPIGRGLAGMVAASRNEMLVPDLRGLQDDDATSAALRDGLATFCGYPLLAAGRLIGVLGLRLERLPEPSDQRLLTTVARVLAQALGAAFLREDQARHARRLEETVEAKTAELKARVNDLEQARLGMLNMMSDALDSQRRLRVLTEKLETTVEDRTREFVLAKEEAERANEAKSQLLGRVSHELRTPLHGIISFARLGIQKIDRADRERNLRYFQQILESAGELMPLIDDLLDISRIEAGKMDSDIRPHDLVAMVRDLAAKQAARLAENDLRIEIGVTDDFPPAVEYDRKQIRQILLNLLGNALKFSPHGAAIDLDLALEGDEVVVTVADRGPGIPADEIDGIFDSFTQSSTTRGQAEGVGLGLAISRALAINHGGSILCENRAGGGTAFHLRWPVRAVALV